MKVCWDQGTLLYLLHGAWLECEITQLAVTMLILYKNLHMTFDFLDAFLRVTIRTVSYFEKPLTTDKVT